MADRSTSGLNPDKVHKNKVLQRSGMARLSVNRAAVVAAACYGTQSRLEQLYREVYRTVKRLRLRTGRAKAFDNPPRGAGGFPNIHDIIPWLDSLDRSHTDDTAFLKSLYKTLEKRIPPGFDVVLQSQALA